MQIHCIWYNMHVDAHCSKHCAATDSLTCSWTPSLFNLSRLWLQNNIRQHITTPENTKQPKTTQHNTQEATEMIIFTPASRGGGKGRSPVVVRWQSRGSWLGPAEPPSLLCCCTVCSTFLVTLLLPFLHFSFAIYSVEILRSIYLCTTC